MYASTKVNGTSNPTSTLIDDLQIVLIGDGLSTGRNKGDYIVRGSRATGFKREFQDEYNQVQHATAGIVIGYKYSFLERTVLKLETEAQDIRLSGAIFPIGEALSKNNI